MIADSHFVADEVSRHSGRGDIEVLPLPCRLALLELRGMAPSVLESSDEPVALNFGNLHRTYKGSTTVLQVAERGVPGRRVALVGMGAPEAAGRAETVLALPRPCGACGNSRRIGRGPPALHQGLPECGRRAGASPGNPSHRLLGRRYTRANQARNHRFACSPGRAAWTPGWTPSLRSPTSASSRGSALLAPRAFGKHINGLPWGLLTCQLILVRSEGLWPRNVPRPILVSIPRTNPSPQAACIVGNAATSIGAAAGSRDSSRAPRPSTPARYVARTGRRQGLAMPSSNAGTASWRKETDAGCLRIVRALLRPYR